MRARGKVWAATTLLLSACGPSTRPIEELLDAAKQKSDRSVYDLFNCDVAETAAFGAAKGQVVEAYALKLFEDPVHRLDKYSVRALSCAPGVTPAAMGFPFHGECYPP